MDDTIKAFTTTIPQKIELYNIQCTMNIDLNKPECFSERLVLVLVLVPILVLVLVFVLVLVLVIVFLHCDLGLGLELGPNTLTWD